VSYQISVKVDAPPQDYDVGKVAAAVGLALSNDVAMSDIVVQELWVERADA